MTFLRIKTGKKGEDLAFSYLKKAGYKIIERNYRTKCGEIDIIAKDKDIIVFIEVRSGNTEKFGFPEETINRRKQQQIAKSALFYIKRCGLEKGNARFDVACIKDVDSEFPKVNLIKNAFELDTRYTY